MNHADDTWVFAYGSLMWNPGFPHAERRRARLGGYSRRMCVYSHTYRGTPDAPGLVLGLDRGGACVGVAFRVTPEDRAAALAYLDARELGDSHVYARKRLTAATPGGAVPVWAYVVRRDHPEYAGGLDPETVFRLIRDGRGRNGACRDYLLSTLAHVRTLGIVDRSLEALAARLVAEPPSPSAPAAKEAARA